MNRATEPLLEITGIELSYGHQQVLFGVDITVQAGEIVALVGTNGAGKSSLLRVVSGLARPSRGSISFGGRAIDRTSAEARVALGIVQAPGGRAVFPSLTVEDNLALGGYLLLRDRATYAARRDDVLEQFPVLRARLDQAAGTLSGGEQQMLALAKALLLEPRLLCIDELSLGLAPAVVEELVEVVGRLRATGTTLVIVEQSINVASAIADRVMFMEKGTVRFEGPAAELLERGDLLRAVFLGGPAPGEAL